MKNKCTLLFNLLVLMPSVFYAQTVVENKSDTTEQESQNLEEIVTIGTRSSGRIVTDNAVPVDIIDVSKAKEITAKTDVTSLLNMMAPSFNYNKQSGSDGADAVDLASLRGLGTDQTLVLINGKRRHQTAFTSIFGTRGRGNSGTDLNAIPESSIERIEILRDGASAQYGSDAIAGVINITLKKSIKKFSANIGWAGYYDNKFNSLNSVAKNEYKTSSWIDGNTEKIGLNYGLPIGKNNGFINLSANFLLQSRTFRQAPDTNLATNPDALPVNTGRRALGDGAILSGGGMFNAEIPIANTKTMFYSFGGYNQKNVESYAYSRNFAKNPIDRFPTDKNGNLIFVDGIMRYTTPNDQNSITYDPIIKVRTTDASFAFGFKGLMRNGWNWDISNVTGVNNFHYYGEQTFNASIIGVGGSNKNSFDDGGYYFFQNTLNAGMSKKFNSVAKGFLLSFGIENRTERYGIYAGEEASYKNYNTSTSFEKGTGAQGFPGFTPKDETNSQRFNYGIYVDGELDITQKWLLTGAARTEYYSDFGALATFKLTTRYKITPQLNIRASASTGYRAPSLQQINYSNTFSNVQGGKIFEVLIAPNNNPVTQAANIPKLDAEKSTNASMGFSYTPLKSLTISVDGYYIKIRNRIVLSGQFDNKIPALTSILNSLNIGQAQFYANAVNTTNYGLDLVVHYNLSFNNQQRVKILLAGNIQKAIIDQINVPSVLAITEETKQAFYSDREQAYLLASAPRFKSNLNLEYAYKKLTVGTNFTLYGPLSILGYNGIVDLDATGEKVKEEFKYSPKLVSDVYATYKLSNMFTFYIGCDNVFNIHPDYGVVPGARNSAYNSEAGGAWDPVQMGYNGRRLFAKIAINL